jgi:transcriptional regulator with XRE-family HTH domain
MKTIGRNLKTARLAKGLTQEQAAGGIGVRAYQRLEAGEGNPTLETLLEVADRLEKPLGELLGSGLARTPSKVENKKVKSIPDFSASGEFLSKFSALSPVRQKFLLAIVHKNEEFLADEPSLVPVYRTLVQVRDK